MKPKIIKKTKDYLIINKPAGLLTHGAKHIQEDNLADILAQKYPEIKNVGDDPWRPGIVHRLDKLASGLLVVARRNRAFHFIKQQFMDRTVAKTYIALVYGQVSKDEDEINFPIKRSSKGNKMAALPETFKGEANADGRNAASCFTVEKRFINYTLLKVRIKTGRTHQIRVHLAAYGHPLVGDDLYGTKKTKAKNAKLSLGRIFLMSSELEFSDLAGNKQKFTIGLDPELEAFLEKAK